VLVLHQDGEVPVETVTEEPASALAALQPFVGISTIPICPGQLINNWPQGPSSRGQRVRTIHVIKQSSWTKLRLECKRRTKGEDLEKDLFITEKVNLRDAKRKKCMVEYTDNY
jgi:hypothetical protein